MAELFSLVKNYKDTQINRSMKRMKTEGQFPKENTKENLGTMGNFDLNLPSKGQSFFLANKVMLYIYMKLYKHQQ